MVYSGVPITPIYSMVIQCRFNYLVYDQTFSQTTRGNKVTTAYREGFNLANVDLNLQFKYQGISGMFTGVFLTSLVSFDPTVQQFDWT